MFDVFCGSKFQIANKDVILVENSSLSKARQRIQSRSCSMFMVAMRNMKCMCYMKMLSHQTFISLVSHAFKNSLQYLFSACL